MKGKFKEIKDGEWIEIPMANFKMECCQCSLVHSIDFKYIEGHLFMKAKRDIKLTNKQRKIKKITIQYD